MNSRTALDGSKNDPLELANEVLANPHRYSPSAEALARAYIAEHRRYQWAANELLACDYGDNDKGEIGWLVYGWRQPRDVHREDRKRIYGSSINEAIDAELP